tara:strand:+ start:722 stop:1006 length:285 start_codon:yes stop_codon:yes gene_type:complete
MKYISIIGMIGAFGAVWYFLIEKTRIHNQLLSNYELSNVKKYIYLANPFVVKLPDSAKKKMLNELKNKASKCIIGWILSLFLFYFFLYLLVSLE